MSVIFPTRTSSSKRDMRYKFRYKPKKVNRITQAIDTIMLGATHSMLVCAIVSQRSRQVLNSINAVKNAIKSPASTIAMFVNFFTEYDLDENAHNAEKSS